MSKILGFIAFVSGGAIGVGASYMYFKKKYQQISEEEIESVKHTITNRYEKRITELTKELDQYREKDEPAEDVENTDVKKEIAAQAKDKPDISEYAEKVRHMNYSGFSESKKKEVVPEPVTTKFEDRPYVISPDEFGEEDDYERIELTYYSDDVLTNDNDDIVDDVDNVVGSDALTRFGEYEADSVFVRNDRLKTDYQILMDGRRYEEVINRRPHRR